MAAAGVSRGRERSATGSGISSAPTKAIANSTSSATYGSTRGAGANWTSVDGDEHAEPHAARADDAVGQPDAGRVAARVQVEHRGRAAAPSARPVAMPWMPRATNSHATETASMKSTVVTSSVRRATPAAPAGGPTRR